MQIREILVEFKKGVKAVKHTKKNADPAKQFAKAKEKLEPVKPMEESGLQYHTGVKKHGEKYMKMAAAAGRRGASQAELGRLRDQHSKAYKNKNKTKEGVAEGVNDYLWHGSRNEHEILYPRQANDTGGKEESNKNAIYATPSAKVAIAMGLTTPGSDTGMFPNDPQMVLFKGGIRKGQVVYLHKVPKDLFIKHNGREWYSKPEVTEIKPLEVKAIPVDKYLNLIRQATPADLELQKKFMKQGVAEGLGDTRTEIISEYNDWKFVVEIQEEDDRYVRFFSAINPSGKEYSLPKGTSVAEFRQFVRSKSVAEAYDPWDEADVWYRYDSSEGKLKKRSFYHAQERDARANGWSDSLEQALRRADIIRSKFNPNQFVQKVGDKWVKVYPFGQPDGIKETASPGATSAGMVATLGMNPKLSPGPARGKKSYIGSPGKSGTKAPPQPKVKQPKSKYGTAKNALDMKSNIFGGGAIKRK